MKNIFSLLLSLFAYSLFAQTTGIYPSQGSDYYTFENSQTWSTVWGGTNRTLAHETSDVKVGNGALKISSVTAGTNMVFTHKNTLLMPVDRQETLAVSFWAKPVLNDQGLKVLTAVVTSDGSATKYPSANSRDLLNGWNKYQFFISVNAGDSIGSRIIVEDPNSNGGSVLVDDLKIESNLVINPSFESGWFSNVTDSGGVVTTASTYFETTGKDANNNPTTIAYDSSDAYSGSQSLKFNGTGAYSRLGLKNNFETKNVTYYNSSNNWLNDFIKGNPLHNTDASTVLPNNQDIFAYSEAYVKVATSGRVRISVIVNYYSTNHPSSGNRKTKFLDKFADGTFVQNYTLAPSDGWVKIESGELTINETVVLEAGDSNMDIQGIEFALQAIDADMEFNVDDIKFNYSISETNNLKNDSFAALGLKLFPNPVKNTLSITSDKNISGIKIKSISGQTIKIFDAIEDVLDINVSDLAPGVYLIEVVVEGEIAITKYIKS